MRKNIYFIVVLLAMLYSSQSAYCKTSVIKYEIDIPKEMKEESAGFEPGLGSGLDFSKQLPNGDLEFFLITDRGPNCVLHKSDGSLDLIAMHPQFVPKISRVIAHKEASDGSYVADYLNLYNSVIISPGTIKDRFLQPILEPVSIDAESVAILDDDTFIVGDEYGPHIYFIDRHTGESKGVLKPGDGLPNIFRDRSINRGIEALTVAPNGKIYAALEGTLDINGQTQSSAQLIRFVEIDPKTHTTRSFAYQIDCSIYKDSSVVKIGDMNAIDNENFIIVEQGKKKDGSMQNLIYKINLSSATDISDLKLKDGAELECTDNSEDLAHINFIQKSLILNPRDYGWKYEKMEGIAFIDDHRIAVSNDNDFGIEKCFKKEIPCQNQDGDSKTDMCYATFPQIDHSNQKTHLWIFELSEGITTPKEQSEYPTH